MPQWSETSVTSHRARPHELSFLSVHRSSHHSDCPALFEKPRGRTRGSQGFGNLRGALSTFMTVGITDIEDHCGTLICLFESKPTWTHPSAQTQPDSSKSTTATTQLTHAAATPTQPQTANRKPSLFTCPHRLMNPTPMILPIHPSAPVAKGQL